MGCDIHSVMEIFVDGAWRLVGETKTEDGFTRVDYEPLNDRNYDFFGLLAGVRREVPNPIAAGRGTPEDISWDESECGFLGDHSFSWVSLADIEAYDFTHSQDHEGWVNPHGYAEFKVDGRPSSYSQSVGGGSVRHVTNRDMEIVISKAIGPREDGSHWPFHDLWHHHGPAADAAATQLRIEAFAFGSPYTLVKWQQPYYENAKELLLRALPRMWKERRDHGLTSEQVRIVFGFDS